MRQKMACVIWTICSLSALGCDPVRTTKQTFSVRVVDAASGKPVANARLKIKYDYDLGEAKQLKLQQVSQSQYDSGRKHWNDEPWLSCSTDSNGLAQANIVLTSLDRTKGSKPPPICDTIKDEPYLFKVTTANEEPEVLSVFMQPGRIVRGERFIVTIVEIHDPVYIETLHE